MRVLTPQASLDIIFGLCYESTMSSSKWRKESKSLIEGWLDDTEQRHGKVTSRPKNHQKKLNPHTSAFLPREEANATVTEVHPKLARAVMDDTKNVLLCSYRRASVYKELDGSGRARSPVTIGDRVRVQPMGSQDGVIEGLSERINLLSRPAPGRDGVVYHSIAANLDRLVIVSSVHEPDFSGGLVDRFWIAAQRQNLPSMLVVNKLDLWNADQEDTPWIAYEGLPGIKVHAVSTKTGFGIEKLKRSLSSLACAFCGHSGVGKSSLLNALTGNEERKIGSVNAFTKKGKHTTTSSTLIELPDGSRWIDTPGIRSFGLADLPVEDLPRFYPEFAEASCSERGCLHEGEAPECDAARFPRHENYLRIRESILEGSIDA